MNIEEVNTRLKRLRKRQGQLRSPTSSINGSEEEDNYEVHFTNGKEVLVLE